MESLRGDALKVVLFFLTLLLSSCAVITHPVPGLLYSDVYSGLAVTPVKYQNVKVGRSCVRSILGLFAFGDASIESARKNGRMSRIAHIDQYGSSIMGVYAKYCTLAYGI